MVIVLTIGRTVLAVLLILVCLLAVILFSPALYKIDFNIDEKRVNVQINWLFRLVRFRFRLEERMEALLSIFFVKIDFTDPEAKRKRQEKKEKKRAKEAAKRKNKRLKQVKKRNQRNNDQQAEYQIDLEQKQMSDLPESEKEKVSEEDFQSHGTEKKNSKIKDTIGMVSAYGKTASRLIHLLKEHEVLSCFWPKLLRFLLRIRPRKLFGHVQFGLEDPAATGKVVGAVAMVPIFYQTEIQIIPDFESEEFYIQGHVFTQGHILLIHVVILLAGLIREKKIRQFIGAVRKKG